MGDRSEKTGIQDKPSVCPYRINTSTSWEYYENFEPVVTDSKVEYAPCYKEACPAYQYDIDKLKYICRRMEKEVNNE